ncbi:hypothetical protein PG991_009192 [Apiospora marii]|uniref:Uncharacterized protein n=1 Tax=Apiospora marii TaxID=335849 RepID=A0ABR1RJZ8_9PEZI
MASTPATSFSDDGQRGVDKTRATDDSATDQHDKVSHTLSLPSPQSSPRSPLDSDVDEVDEVDDKADDKAIEEAYAAVWDHFCGFPAYDNPVFIFQNGQASFLRFLDKLATQPGLEDHFHTLRSSWWAFTGHLEIILMTPTPLHCVFLEYFKIAIHEELKRIAAQDPNLAPFCRKIHPGGDATVTEEGDSAKIPTWYRSPDAQLRYNGAEQAHFVMEVAYSQSTKALQNKSEEYLLKNRCTTLCLDIPYDSPEERLKGNCHSGTVSLFTSELDPNDEETINIRALRSPSVFCKENAQPVPGNLNIPFKYFVPVDERTSLPDSHADASVKITFEALTTILRDAEASNEDFDRRRLAVARDEPKPKRVRYIDSDGDITREDDISDSEPPKPSKRLRTTRQSSSYQALVLGSDRVLRSSSGPRRSARLRSASRGRTLH